MNWANYDGTFLRRKCFEITTESFDSFESDGCFDADSADFASKKADHTKYSVQSASSASKNHYSSISPLTMTRLLKARR